MSLRLTDEEFDLALKPDVKPTPKVPGYWRCVLWLERPECWIVHGAIPLGNNEFVCGPKYVSEEVADEEGRAAERRRVGTCRVGLGEVRYRRAEYFPDYPSGGA